MATPAIEACRHLIAREFSTRNGVSRAFFAREAEHLAAVCARMSERFLRGGRLLAFGSGTAISDAQHVVVEFVHPVLVGKQALPALDLSGSFEVTLPALLRPEDIVMGFDSSTGDSRVSMMLAHAADRGALTLALPGSAADYAVAGLSSDPFVQQEIIEVLYHVLWETVHLFVERQPVGHDDAGAAAFLYPFLGETTHHGDALIAEAADSIRSKAASDERLRHEVAAEQSDAIGAAVLAIDERVRRGGCVLCFGNGGSATDATDLAFDLVASPKGQASIPALSLATEPATLTAIANDVGSDAIFARQVIAHGRPQDVAVAISTSGGSANVVNALGEARARGLLTIALTGYDGGDILRRRLADHVLVVRSDHIPRVQEIHASIYHVMRDLLHEIRRSP
jgi:D-sedoheptulose 7-phosphate isomerase